MYEEAIVLGLGLVSVILAYIASQIDEGGLAGVIKVSLLAASGINVMTLVNVCAKIAEDNTATSLADMLNTGTYPLISGTLTIAGILIFAKMIIWVVEVLIEISNNRGKMKGNL
jgi:hypothetical protein